MTRKRMARTAMLIANAGRDLRTPMNDLIAQHGRLRVALALMRAACRRRPRARHAPMCDLSDHILRDIGLEPRDGRARDRPPLWQL